MHIPIIGYAGTDETCQDRKLGKQITKRRSNTLEVVLPQRRHKKAKQSITIRSASPTSNSSSPATYSSSTGSETSSLFPARPSTPPSSAGSHTPPSSPSGSHISVASPSEYSTDGTPSSGSLSEEDVSQDSGDVAENDPSGAEQAPSRLQPFKRLSRLPKDRQQTVMAPLRQGKPETTRS
ncbi:hypothetical protein I314_05171 [Cryptococcus bacillisporus CA1873]|uniref:Uncharacterized protein n=1 Tax=Cryptococcus bacillisporus CA1873 TaxID=1296111 RepID=A0ABR5B6G2_CRYGA|nr:hypothetical protein I314_05171 [Cryptococcus bacillisporus CA1873]|eukprot:KIR59185.1 hypothetical protein I314_05171 [Cryptococcus gattii CA1873]